MIIQFLDKRLLGRLLVAEAIQWQITYLPKALRAATESLDGHASAETEGIEAAAKIKKAHM